MPTAGFLKGNEDLKQKWSFFYLRWASGASASATHSPSMHHCKTNTNYHLKQIKHNMQCIRNKWSPLSITKSKKCFTFNQRQATSGGSIWPLSSCEELRCSLATCQLFAHNFFCLRDRTLNEDLEPTQQKIVIHNSLLYSLHLSPVYMYLLYLVF